MNELEMLREIVRLLDGGSVFGAYQLAWPIPGDKMVGIRCVLCHAFRRKENIPQYGFRHSENCKIMKLVNEYRRIFYAESQVAHKALPDS